MIPCQSGNKTIQNDGSRFRSSGKLLKTMVQKIAVWWFQICFMFIPIQMGWFNHQLVGIDHLDQSTLTNPLLTDGSILMISIFFSIQLFRWFLPFIATLTTMDSLRDHITLELTEDDWHLKGWISWELTTQKSADFWFQLRSPFSVWHAQGVWRWNWNNGSLRSPPETYSFPKKGTILRENSSSNHWLSADIR